MLQDEYDRLAKSVGYVSERQAKDIIYIALEKIKRDANGGIVEVWTINHDVRGVGILRSYIRLADRGIPAPQDIVLDLLMRILVADISIFMKIHVLLPLFLSNIGTNCKQL
jgi:hypothetical protein